MDNKFYSYIAIIAGVISFAYWSLFGANALYTFHEYNDLGTFAYNMYVYLHYPQFAHGFQILIYGNHVVPDFLFLLPIYYVAQSALTLLVIQAFVLSLTGVVVFFVAKDLIKRPLLALGISLAFLLNPGVFGMLVFDFHAEAFIALFYILTFYFYMKNKRNAFFVSAILLLGTIEEAPFLAATLGLVLLLYEYRFTQDAALKRRRLIMSGSLIVLSLLTFAFYSFVVSSLQSGYSQGQYAGLPAILPAFPIAQNQLGNLANPFPSLGFEFSGMLTYTLYAMLIIFFGFGIAVVFDPLSTLILLSPWLGEFFVIGNSEFAFVFNQYFGFVIPCTVVAVILAIVKIDESKGIVVNNLFKGDEAKKEFVLKKVVPGSLAVMVVLLLVLLPTFMLSKNVDNFGQNFFFQVGPQQQALDTRLYSVLSYLPPNASVLTTYFIFPHVANRQNIELLYPYDYYFQPNYILVDFDLNVSLNVYSFNQPQQFTAFWTNNSKNYTLFVRNGTGNWTNSALLFKRIGAQ